MPNLDSRVEIFVLNELIKEPEDAPRQKREPKRKIPTAKPPLPKQPAESDAE